MASQAEVRRIALSLAGAEEAPDRFAFSVRNKGKAKGFVWVWMERVDPKKARVPQPKVIAVRVASLYDKDFLLAANPLKFFTERHYAGFPDWGFVSFQGFRRPPRPGASVSLAGGIPVGPMVPPKSLE